LVKVTFAGIAPVPKGTRVRILVDDVKNPTIAFQVEDKDRNITYKVSQPQTTKLVSLKSGAVEATIDQTVVYAGNQTDLYVTIPKP
jgi:hypothetical protein